MEIETLQWILNFGFALFNFFLGFGLAYLIFRNSQNKDKALKLNKSLHKRLGTENGK